MSFTPLLSMLVTVPTVLMWYNCYLFGCPSTTRGDRCIIQTKVCHNIKPILTNLMLGLGLGLVLYCCVVQIMHLIRQGYNEQVFVVAW